MLFFDHTMGMRIVGEVGVLGVLGAVANAPCKGFSFGDREVSLPRDLGTLFQRLRRLLRAKQGGVGLALCTGLTGPSLVREILGACDQPTVVLSMLGGVGTTFSTKMRPHRRHYKGSPAPKTDVVFADGSDEMRELARALSKMADGSILCELIAQARAEAEPVRRGHLAQCEFCRSRSKADALARLRPMIAEALGHPAFELPPLSEGQGGVGTALVQRHAGLQAMAERLRAADEQLRASEIALAEWRAEVTHCDAMLPPAPTVGC
jgi:hypothetical protein